jgi:hypothetical protein
MVHCIITGRNTVILAQKIKIQLKHMTIQNTCVLDIRVFYVSEFLFLCKCTAVFICVLLTVHHEYNGVKENQINLQLILSIFRQALHVSGVSRPIIRRYNRVYTAIGSYFF